VGNNESESDESMDEGVKVGNARQSTLRSPKTTNADFKTIDEKNKNNMSIIEK
jgi:hypothetical protein